MSPERVGMFPHRWEAEAAAGYLADHDIDAKVVADDGGQLGPDLSFGQIGLPVHSDDADEARRLLAFTPGGESGEGERRGHKTTSEWIVAAVGVAVLAGLILLLFLVT